jgi:hypothetical protein
MIATTNTPTRADNFELWKTALTDPTVVVPNAKKPKVDSSYDMAWQQRALDTNMTFNQDMELTSSGKTALESYWSVD